jgi:hypothetical protein
VPAPQRPGGKPVKRKFKLTAEAANGKRDRDKVTLRCVSPRQ